MKRLSFLVVAAFAAALSASAQTITSVINLSARGTVGPISGALTTGFIVDGSNPKSVLVRGVGPALANFGVSAASSDVAVTVYDQNGNVVATNDGYLSGSDSGDVANAAAAVGAFPLSGSGDSGLLLTLNPGAYTVTATAGAAATSDGVGLVEVYDADAYTGNAGSTLIANFSASGALGTGVGQLTLGFVIGGSNPQNIFLQGVGPDLANYGVTNAASSVALSIYDVNGNLLASNSGGVNMTDDSGMQEISSDLGDSSITNTSDSAVLVNLTPGAYTVGVSSLTSSSTAVAMVEGFDLDTLQASF